MLKKERYGHHYNTNQVMISLLLISLAIPGQWLSQDVLEYINHSTNATEPSEYHDEIVLIQPQY